MEIKTENRTISHTVEMAKNEYLFKICSYFYSI